MNSLQVLGVIRLNTGQNVHLIGGDLPDMTDRAVYWDVKQHQNKKPQSKLKVLGLGRCNIFYLLAKASFWH